MYALLCLIAASVHSLATPIGSLLSGVFVESIGRRGSLQLSVIPLCIGWLIISLSRNVTILLVGRFICGISVGLMAVPAQVRDMFTERARDDVSSAVQLGKWIFASAEKLTEIHRSKLQE